jgi:hypothetical protein
MNKLKSVFAVALVTLMLSFSAFAEFAHDTFGTTDVQQISYSEPVWRITNLAPVPAIVRYAQDNGYNLTITLPANGGYYELGGPSTYYEWTCKNGGRPSVSPTVIIEPNYANHVAGTATYCTQ